MTGSLFFKDVERSASAREGETVYETARRCGVRIIGACGGRGTCGSCMIRIDGARKWERACLTRLDGDASVEIAPRSLAPIVRAEAEGAPETVALDPDVKTRVVTAHAPTLAHPIADDDNVIAGLEAGPAAARALSETLRAHDWTAELRVRDDRRLIDAVPPGRPLLGFAVDLGTTNIAGFLIDLRTGERIAGLGVENPQVGWGADVISRINAAARDRQSEADLTGIVRGALSALVHDLCLAVGATPRDVVEAAICGNTAMHHLLLGLPTSQLGRAPFVASLRNALAVPARDVGLEICPDAILHIAANIGGFVGGDHVTALLACEDDWTGDGVTLVMDIGTNTEISVIHDGLILSASSPSGPALEGGNISCGMRAAEGAIEKVWAENGRLRIATIAEAEPIGLCGSGVLDALAAGQAVGAIAAGGRICAGHGSVVMRDGKPFVRLAEDVLLGQHDIRAVQLAKSAIRTATQMLLEAANLREEAIDRFLIAGSFGAYLSVESGIAIGLFPDLPRERFRQIGNAAGAGVRRMAASREARARAARIAAAAHYVELSARPGFQKSFLANLNLPAIGTNLRTAS